MNVYFAMLERKVGLCNVVKTAMTMGVTRADGRSLTQWDGKTEPPADDLPSFTLGSVNVSPMSMAAAYATVAARGMYCKPVAVAKIISPTGAKLPVESAGCHQAHPGRGGRRGQLHPAGRADLRHRGRPGHRPPGGGQDRHLGQLRLRRVRRLHPRPGRLRVGVQPDRPGQVPDERRTGSCYRLGCTGEMFGADAPAHTWQMTFQHAALANPPLGFVMSDINPELWSMGNGQVNPSQKKKGKGNGPRRGRR